MATKAATAAATTTAANTATATAATRQPPDPTTKSAVSRFRCRQMRLEALSFLARTAPTRPAAKPANGVSRLQSR